MKRSLVLLTLLAPLVLGACERGTPVVVEATIAQQAEGAEARPLTGLPIRILPYDRDVIFDSLASAASSPEPEIPADVLQQQAQVQEAQERWQAANDRWQNVRDSLRTIGNELQSMEQRGLRASPQYNQAFQAFGRLEAEERQLRQQSDASFTRFTQLQEAAAQRAEEIRVQRESWADEAFRNFDQAVAGRLQQLRREEIVDTTDAMGRIRVRVPEGRWWIYSRYTLPFSELYWNIPIEVQGDSVRIDLNRQNAQSRPLL
jgi:tetratricopeptide (TPR) repeat protein